MMRLTLAIAFLTTFGFIAVVVIDKIIGKNKKQINKPKTKTKKQTK